MTKRRVGHSYSICLLLVTTLYADFEAVKYDERGKPK